MVPAIYQPQISLRKLFLRRRITVGVEYSGVRKRVSAPSKCRKNVCTVPGVEGVGQGGEAPYAVLIRAIIYGGYVRS